MCEAIKGILERGRAEGRAERRAEERAIGIKEGFFKALNGLVENKVISLSDAAKQAGMTETDFCAQMNAKKLS